jgi:[ribosomal protein S18]-alanine N-acetyltransferase
MIDFSRLEYSIDPMRSSDLDQVMRIETLSYSAPWSKSAFDYELHYNQIAHYFVARRHPQIGSSEEAARRPARHFWARWLEGESAETTTHQLILGYGGFWKMVDEAHISTIAVAPEYRRQGIGELLIVTMIDSAQQVGAHLVTLEVRKSNENAQALYRKYGFEIVGERKRYYSDNGEDAWIMTTPAIESAEYNQLFRELKDNLLTRLAA